MAELPFGSNIPPVVAKVSSLSSSSPVKGQSAYKRTARLIDRNGGTSGVNLFGHLSEMVEQGKFYRFTSFKKTEFNGQDKYHWLGQKTNSEVYEVDGW